MQFLWLHLEAMRLGTSGAGHRAVLAWTSSSPRGLGDDFEQQNFSAQAERKCCRSVLRTGTTEEREN